MSTFPITPKDGLYLQDDFACNDAVADTTVGNLNWEIAAIGNASTLAYVTGEPYGVLRLTTAATADGDGEYMRLFTDGLAIKPGAVFGARIRYPDITGNVVAANNFRVGLDDSVVATTFDAGPPVTITAPTKGIWFDSDGGVLHGLCHSAASGDNYSGNWATDALRLSTALNTGLTKGTWYDLEFRCDGLLNATSGPANVFFYVNGVHKATVPCLLGATETVELKIIHWQDQGGAQSYELDIDYVYYFLPR